MSKATTMSSHAWNKRTTNLCRGVAKITSSTQFHVLVTTKRLSSFTVNITTTSTKPTNPSLIKERDSNSTQYLTLASHKSCEQNLKTLQLIEKTHYGTRSTTLRFSSTCEYSAKPSI
nr:hypothetical protein Itr_chr03CG25080 [Ipomoea trifida]